MASLFQSFGVTGVAFIDFETTGLDPRENHPTEIAIKKVGVGALGKVYVRDYQTMIKLPEGVEISEFIQKLTGLTTEKVNSEGKDITEVIPEVQNLIDSNTLVVAQSANFDLGYLAVHFGIEPAHFMCTKTIEFFTAPHLSTKLNDTHARYAPEATFEQTHRAMDDVEMLMDIFNGQVGVHGNEAMMFFKNKIAIPPERPLVFYPDNAIILDYSQKYVSSKTHNELKERVEYLEERDDELSRLEAYGVDNWCGYGEAMSDSMGIFEEE
jgi:DNA polymerase III epsilon subunit-like protein